MVEFIGNITSIKTGKLDVNAENPQGKYPFFTCSKNHTYIDDYAFEGESILVAGNGDLNVKYYNGKFNAYQRTYVIQPQETLNGKYLYYFLETYVKKLREQSIGGVIKYIKLGNLTDAKIPFPPLPTQQKIASILDKADEIRQYNKQLIEKYNALTQSLFLEMFGDPVKNEKGWEIKELHLVALISSGITKGRKNNILDSIGEIPYMRVANVQDGYLDLREIKTIPAFKTDLEKFLLKKGDVLMTEGGDPDKLGRGAVWQNEIEQCLHQNHIFKVRVDSNLLTPLYFNKLASSLYGKKYFLKIAKQTTGIATINKTQLSKFPVLMASIDLQNQFAEQLQLIETQKQQAQEALAKSDDLFQSLLQRAFNGELN